MPRGKPNGRTTHGKSGTPTHRSWKSMIARCYCSGSSGYKHYGGRGIQVCLRWRGPKGFALFLADMGERPDGMTLERIDYDGNYTPRNCRWAPQVEQVLNSRHNRCLTHRNETLSVSQWAKRLGVRAAVIHARLYYGWTEEESLTIPVLPRGKPKRTYLHGRVKDRREQPCR